MTDWQVRFAAVKGAGIRGDISVDTVSFGSAFPSPPIILSQNFSWTLRDASGATRGTGE